MSGIPDEAVEATAVILCATDRQESVWAILDESERDAFRTDARAALSAALPAIERAHLERLAVEAHAEAERPAPAMERFVPSAAEGWLRARLDQTKDPEQ